MTTTKKMQTTKKQLQYVSITAIKEQTTRRDHTSIQFTTTRKQIELNPKRNSKYIIPSILVAKKREGGGKRNRK